MTQRMFTADLVVICGYELLLIKRLRSPFQGVWALPGGKQNPEDRSRLEITAIWELREETGIEITSAQLRFIGTFDRPGRDPRGDSISTAFLVQMSAKPETLAGDDAAAVSWFSLRTLPALAFDHDEIVRQALLLAGLDVRPVLSGERLHAAYRTVRDFVRSWGEIDEAAQAGYNDMAHILCQQLLLCEGCGKQQERREHLHEVAGLLLCSECIAPPPEVRAIEYLAMADVNHFASWAKLG